METQMEPERMRRAPRACLRCRKQKVKCNLDGSDGPATPPCRKCTRAGTECVMVSSRRGVRRDRVRTTDPAATEPPSGANDSTPLRESSGGQSGRANTNISPLPTSFEGLASEVEDVNTQRTDFVSTAIDDTFASTNLHNTSDALNFLSQAARCANQVSEGVISQNVPSQAETLIGNFGANESDLLQYHLVAVGVLTLVQVADLVQRFATLYHPYYPIAPNKVLQRRYLNETARNEPLLLTAIMTIALKDLPGTDQQLRACSRYMDELIVEVTAGKRRGVDAVETLLLLAEWEPQSSTNNSTNIGCGDEDNAAWMHIGLAIRLAFLLRLDRGYSKGDNENRLDSSHRERLAWVACYLSDRQVSVRVGRAFEARDGGLAATYRGYSFPSLLPQNSNENNHAKVFQARLELTQIFSNVHEVLYLGMGSTVKATLTGNYVKYLDDFRASINVWKRIWGSLTCSPQVKVLLQLSYEYLRLYTNAYAFQATTIRSLPLAEHGLQSDADSGRDDMGLLPDARFIYEAVDAAKSLLTTVNNYIPQDAKLCYFPIRFPLYCVNSAVFLYKAWSLKILSGGEKSSIRCLISDTIKRLRKDSTRPSDLGARYARLLELLWQRTDENQLPGPEDTSVTADNPSRQPPTPHHALGFGQDEFSWLDLQAVGDILSGYSRPEADTGMGNMQQFVEAPRRDSMSWNDMGWPVEHNSSRFF